MFKLDNNQVGRFKLVSDVPFSWLEGKKPHIHHMGLERFKEIENDLSRLKSACFELGITLPIEFVKFMQSVDIQSKFRSVNAGFFDIGSTPVRCPVSEGYLIPFISDQQYCHFYYLHVVPHHSEYEILWTDDLYHDAIYANPEEFETCYMNEFDKGNIYLIDNDFEHFMLCHYENHEKWFANEGL